MANTSLNTNRLNLPNMVDSQLKDTVVPTETYFNPVFFDSSAGKRQKQIPMQNLAPRTSIETSFNSIVATVHNNLRNREIRLHRSKAEVTKTELTIPETEVNANKAKTPLPSSSTKTLPLPLTKMLPLASLPKKIPLPTPPTKAANTPILKAKPNSEPEYKLTTPKPKIADKFHMPIRAQSIPQLKAIREQRSMQRMRRNVGRAEEMTDYMRRKRMNEVVQQKRILEDMLQQHYKLQRDRQTIASEIQTMREHLNHIRDRLDTSLKKLNTKCTVCESSPRPRNIINQNRMQRPIITKFQR